MGRMILQVLMLGLIPCLAWGQPLRTVKVEMATDGPVPDQVCLVLCGKSPRDIAQRKFCERVTRHGQTVEFSVPAGVCFTAVGLKGGVPSSVSENTSEEIVRVKPESPAIVDPPRFVL